ncbi:hypothetical protein ACE1SV_69310 [Streptomyces sennicomposti]
MDSGIRGQRHPWTAAARRAAVAAPGAYLPWPRRTVRRREQTGAPGRRRTAWGRARALETAALRRHRLPQCADVPCTEAHFTESADAIVPLGAKSVSESAFDPVAPAFATALRDATASASPHPR